jgi:hypothetical protein
VSRRASVRKRARQRKRHEQRPRQLAAPISPITGLEEQALQTPTRSDIRKISTAALFKELLCRPESKGLITAIAEANAHRV